MFSSSRSKGIRVRSMLAIVATATLGSLAAAGQSHADFVETGSWGGSWSALEFAPTSLDIADSGDVVIGDAGFRRIARIDSAGNLDATWRTGPRPVRDYPRTDDPIGVAVDPDGNVFEADQTDRLVRKFSAGGDLLNSWPLSGDSGIYGIEYDSSGSVLVLRNEEVELYSESGELQGSWGGFSSDASDPVFNTDDSGEVLVAGTEVTGEVTGEKVIYRFTLDGELLDRWATPAAVSLSPPFYCQPGPGSISGISGYVGVAAREGGGAWVVPFYGDHLVEGVSPSGEVDAGFSPAEGKVGQLEVGPDGHFWIASNELTYYSPSEEGNLVSEYGPDGSPIAQYGSDFFPRYFDDDLGEGKFEDIDALGVSPGGKVDVFDEGNARTQRFSESGAFDWFVGGPGVNTLLGFEVGAHQLLYGTGDGPRLLDTAPSRVYSYSDSGLETQVTDLDLPGIRTYGGTGAGGGNMWIGSGPPSQMSLVDEAGQVLDTFPMPEVPEPYLPRERVTVRLTPTGNLLVLSRTAIREYTTGGSFVRGWDLPAQTSIPQYPTMSVGADGKVYVLLQTSPVTLWTFSANGTKLDEYPVGPDADGASVKEMALSSTGIMYLANRNTVYRYEETGARASSSRGTARICCTDCDYEEPEPGTLSIKNVKFAKDRRSASLKLQVPSSGRLDLLGGSKIRKRSIRTSAGGIVDVRVALKKKYRKPVRRPSRVKVRLTAFLSFDPDGYASTEPLTISRKLALKRKLIGRR